MYVKPFIDAVGKQLLQYLLKCALHLSSWRLKCIVKEIQWELAEKILFQEICASYESLKKRDH